MEVGANAFVAKPVGFGAAALCHAMDGLVYTPFHSGFSQPGSRRPGNYICVLRWFVAGSAGARIRPPIATRLRGYFKLNTAP